MLHFQELVYDVSLSSHVSYIPSLYKYNSLNGGKKKIVIKAGRKGELETLGHLALWKIEAAHPSEKGSRQRNTYYPYPQGHQCPQPWEGVPAAIAEPF